MSDEATKIDLTKYDFTKGQDPSSLPENYTISDGTDAIQGSHIRLESGHEVKVLVVTDLAYICTQVDLGLGTYGWTVGHWADWVKDACREAGVPETQGICLLYKSEVEDRQHRPSSKFSLRKTLEEIR